MRKPLLVVLSLSMLSLAAFLPVVHAQTFVTSIPLGNQNLNQAALGPPVFDSANGNIYVSAEGTTNLGTVSIISGSSNTVTSILGLSTPQVRSLPGTGVLDSSNGDIYIPDGPYIHVISGTTNAIIQNITGVETTLPPALDPSNGMMYASNPTQSSVSVIDTSNNSVIATLQLPSGVNAGPVFDPVSGDVYVPGFNATTVISATTNGIVDTIPFANGADFLALDPSTGSILASGTGTLVVISSSSQVVANVSSGGVAYPVFDTSDSDFYVLTETSGVEVFSATSNSIVGNMNLNFEQVNGTAAGLAIDSANGDVFATFDVSGVVVNDQSITATFGDVISGTTVLGQVQVSNSSSTTAYGGGSAVFDSTNGDFYVPNIDGTVSVINPQVISAPSSTTSSATTKSSSSALPTSYLFLVIASLSPILAVYMSSLRRHRP